MCWPTVSKNSGFNVAVRLREQPSGWPALLSRQMILAAWLPTLLITLLHYLTGPEYHWLHDILRRLYYLPIILAAFAQGLRGGLITSGCIAAAYAPHAFTHLMHMDPAHTLEKVLELLLYGVVGGVSGLLVDRERVRQRELTATTHKLSQSLEDQQRTSDQLVRAGRLAALGELVAGIAHEIKNPIHSLRGTAEVIDPVVPQDIPQRRMWELHRGELDRLEQVAERFLSFARPAPLEQKKIDLMSVIQRTQELISAQARQKQVEVHADPPPEEINTWVMADEQQLIQVLLNICLNALQSMGDSGGVIDFSISRTTRGRQEYLLVSIANSGPPIPDEDIERIFDPFVTNKSEGVGLGLSIASRIVEQHGGFIEPHNLEGGRGVRFDLLLPITPEP